MPIPFRRLATALALLLTATSAAGCDRMPTGVHSESGGVRALHPQEPLPTTATSSADDGGGWLGGGERTSSEDADDINPGMSAGTGWLGGGG